MLYTPLEEWKVREVLTIISNIIGEWSILELEEIEVEITGLILILKRKRKTKIIQWNLYKKLEENILKNAKEFSLKTTSIIISIMIYILFGNLLGLIPQSSVITLDIFLNLIISWIILLLITIICFKQNKENTKYIIIIQNIPILISIFMTLIEFISYLSRIISLTIRLSSNILGSLVLVKLICSLTNMLLDLYSFKYLTFWIFILIILIYIMEIFVAFIQSYIYSILISIYLDLTLSVSL